MKRNFLGPVLSLVFLTILSHAQVDSLPGVARISLIQGDVSTQRGDTDEWAAAALNQPLVGGDRVSTGDNSRAELQLDHGNILRLGNHSLLKIATVERAQNELGQIQVQIWQGLAYYSVFKDSEAEVEIDTPNVAFVVDREGDYRFDVDPNADTTYVSVRRGDGEGTDNRVRLGGIIPQFRLEEGAEVEGVVREFGDSDLTVVVEATEP